MGCVLFWAILITIGVLLIFLVRVPSATVSSTTLQCSSYADCSQHAQQGGIPVQVNISISNPNIVSAYVQSNDLVLTDRTNGQPMATGVIAKQYIASRGHSNVVAEFNFPANTETTNVIAAVFLPPGQSYPININGHLQLSVGALSFTYHLNENENIPAQS